MSPVLEALVRALTHRQQRQEVVFYQPPAASCRDHSWRPEAGTARHDYESCRNEGCGARRIMDLSPLDPPVETVDLQWACGGPVPAGAQSPAIRSEA